LAYELLLALVADLNSTLAPAVAARNLRSRSKGRPGADSLSAIAKGVWKKYSNSG